MVNEHSVATASPGGLAVRTVAIESPYRADTPEELERNKRYLDACIKDCLERGESPYASHKMLTDVLDDDDAVQRKLGIKAGFEWAHDAQCRVFYLDLGCSEGMLEAKHHAQDIGQEIETRFLRGEWSG